MFVGGQDVIESGEGRYQCKQGGFGEVEVCYHRVNDFEFVAGPNEQFGRAFGGGNGPVFCDGFEGSYGSCADGYDAAAFLGGLVYCLCGAGADGESLGVHLVVVEVLGGDWLEGPFADVQGDIGYIDTSTFYLREKFFCEVQSCRGGGDGAGGFCKDGLVAVAVHSGELGIAFSFDIGRQGGEADLVEDIYSWFAGDYFQQPVAGFGPVYGFGVTVIGLVFGNEGDCFARFYLLGVFQHYQPRIWGLFGEEEAFHIGSGLPAGEEPGGQDFGVIEDEAIAGFYVADYVGEVFIFEFICGAVEDEQARFGAGLWRSLSDEFGR